MTLVPALLAEGIMPWPPTALWQVLLYTIIFGVLGILMVIDGLGYLTFSFSAFLSPPFAARMYPYIPMLTAAIGEGSLMVWLLVRGVNAQRWEEQATAAAWLSDA